MRKIRRLLLIGADSQYGIRVACGIHAYCQSSGKWEYHIEDNRRQDTLERARFAIGRWKADGIIAQINDDHVHSLLRRSGLPVVNFSGSFPTNLPTVVVDNVAVGRMVAQHFLANGFRHFAFCARTNEPSAQQRCDGFVGEVSRAGFSCDVFTDHFSGLREKEWFRNRQRMERWLRRLPRPVAMMCMHDPRGQEVSWTCRRLGIRVPDEVALVAVGNSEISCRMCAPPLSSVDTDSERIGYEAAHLLDQMIRGHKPPVSPVLVSPSRVITRQSSDIVAVVDLDIAAAVRFIRDNAHTPIAANDVVKLIPISRRALERRFLQSIGRTPKAEIVRLRMNRAKSLLGETDLSITAIAEQTGFTGAEKFSAAFHRECDQTPTQYRRNARLASSRVQGQ